MKYSVKRVIYKEIDFRLITLNASRQGSNIVRNNMKNYPEARNSYLLKFY